MYHAGLLICFANQRTRQRAPGGERAGVYSLQLLQKEHVDLGYPEGAVGVCGCLRAGFVQLDHLDAEEVKYP